MIPEVAAQAHALEDFLEGIVPETLAEVERVLGSPRSAQPDSTFAMPLCQSRWVSFSGLGAPQRSRLHAEFYAVGGVGGVQVWYAHDSTTVATSLAYLKVDSLFMPYNRRTQNEIGIRLAWDRDHLAVLQQALQRMFGGPAQPDSVLPAATRRGER